MAQITKVHMLFTLVTDTINNAYNLPESFQYN